MRSSASDADEIDDGRQNEHGYSGYERVSVAAANPHPNHNRDGQEDKACTCQPVVRLILISCSWDHLNLTSREATPCQRHKISHNTQNESVQYCSLRYR